ncbi:methyltransferase LaeA [Xylona heveae TC161]|uniref:Methyltransferase LaeA n=1 Tax=Xylona heveae (strain CBS 132557 / TC161) TaxID=1328760 RepID=A0A165GAL4_XYLHT|nr:methyltransferase LaeA [Xylona heveae TC161]KZF21952.1 methyltransferase LaeA [Xylona heveae TC161]
MSTNGLAAPVPPNYMENGRLYHGFRKGIYMYPCDEQEKDRMDIYHKFFLVACHEKLHQAPIRPNYGPPRILDLGTGTGIWAIDMADKYLDAEVLGMDLSNIQPEKIPPNLRFRIPRDYESPWYLGEESWDLIHLRMGAGSVSSWPELYQKIFQHLKPGFGYMEQVEIDMLPRCDDGTMPYHPLVQWYDWLDDATQRASRPVAYQRNTRQMLEMQGFVDIQENVIRIPLNSWPASLHEKDIGRWYNLGLTEGLEALSLGPLTRVYGWPAEDVRRLIVDVKAHMCNKKIHAYNNMHIWTARRPQ